MVVHLGKEQKDDDQHREFCNTEFDVNEDKTNQTLDALNTAIEEASGNIATLADEISTLQADVATSDAAVQAAGLQRKAENAEFIQSQSELNAAAQLIDKATNRLHKFYNPAQYKAPAKRELTDDEKIRQNLGEEIDTSVPET